MEGRDPGAGDPDHPAQTPRRTTCTAPPGLWTAEPADQLPGTQKAGPFLGVLWDTHALLVLGDGSTAVPNAGGTLTPPSYI